MVNVSLSDRCKIVSFYVQKEQTFQEIAHQFPFSIHVVRRVLKEEFVPSRPATTRKEKRRKTSRIWKHAVQVVSLYTEDKLSQRTIAERFGVSVQPIRDILKVSGVTPRSLKESRRYRCDKYGCIDVTKDRIIALRTENLKLQEIAERVGVSTVEVFEILKETDAYIPPGQNTF